MAIERRLYKNQVLENGFRVSPNFYDSDLIFQSLISSEISEDGATYMTRRWHRLGKEAAGCMNELSMQADKNGPELVKRNFYGENINEIRFHPAYEQLKAIAVESEMFRVKWEPALRKRFSKEAHRLGFASGFLYTMAENGVYCPLCMTDGAARLIDRFCGPEEKGRLLPRIYTNKPDELYTGAMFLTEKSGGSDVGANQTTATYRPEDDLYALNGEKWFCSNADAEIIFTLARIDPKIDGTKGLSIFLVEKHTANGKMNTWELVRLKEKLGVRSMASAECIFTNTWGNLVGREGEGFKIMAEMINLSRLYNSISAIGMTRRALIEAYQFLTFRKTFGQEALRHALVRDKLAELASLYLANFYLTWRTIRALDEADNGNDQEAQILRLLTPMTKRSTAANSVYSIRESMELMGGMGYIEDGVMPKFMRDAMVLPIWEGAGNIMLLDMLRACAKTRGLELLFEEISWQLPKSGKLQGLLSKHYDELVQASKTLLKHDSVTSEAFSRPFFEKLTLLYQIANMLSFKNRRSEGWVVAAVAHLAKMLEPGALKASPPPPMEEVDMLIGWVF